MDSPTGLLLTRHCWPMELSILWWKMQGTDLLKCLWQVAELLCDSNRVFFSVVFGFIFGRTLIGIFPLGLGNCDPERPLCIDLFACLIFDNTSCEQLIIDNRGSFPSCSPLGCILQNWEIFSCVPVKRKKIVFYCNTSWLQYSLKSGEQWSLMVL